MTSDDIRAMGDSRTFANGTMTPAQVADEMERQSVRGIEPDEMLVLYDNGRLAPYQASDQAPEGATIVLYGGKTDRERPGDIEPGRRLQGRSWRRSGLYDSARRGATNSRSARTRVSRSSGD